MTAANTPDLRALVERLEAKRMVDATGDDDYCARLVNPDGPAAAAALTTLQHRVAQMEAALSASIGYMTNAKIDLQTGCPKATAIRTIEGGIAKARSTLKDRGEGR